MASMRNICTAKGLTLSGTATTAQDGQGMNEGFRKARLWVILSALSGGGSLVVAVQASMDNTNWYTTTIVDLTTGQTSRTNQGAGVTLSGNTTGELLLEVDHWAPYLRLSLTGNGTGTFTADWVID